MSGRELQIGMCGTFDVANYGDLLFPLIAEVELTRRLGPIRLHRFSYFARTPPDWPYSVTPLADLPEMVGDLDGLLIGGGDLIRFDKAVAPGYQSPSPNVHHPTGYWLTPALLALDGACPVVWNAPGVVGEISTWAEPLMHQVMRLSRYVSVRDPSSRAALARFAGDTDIAVVPDTGFGIGQLFDGTLSPRGERLRAAAGLTRPYFIIQAAAHLQPAWRFIQKERTLFGDHQWLALPVGPVLGDDHTLVAAELPDVVCLPDWPDPWLLSELIRDAAGVVATSLHLSIVALAFGVPVWRPPDALGGKYAVLSQFEGVRLSGSDGAFDPAALAPRSGPDDRVTEVMSRLRAHWDSLASALARRRETPSARTRRAAFWQMLPGLLETESRLATSPSDTFSGEIHRVLGRIGELDATIASLAERLPGVGDTMIAEREAFRSILAERDEHIEALIRQLTAEGDAFRERIDGLIGDRAPERETYRSALAQRDARLSMAGADLAASRHETAAARAEIVALQNSAHYRMTAPLRWIGRRLSARRRENNPA